MEHLQLDIQSKINKSIKDIRGSIYEQAEKNAEIYVSSTLGLEDDVKASIKNQYIEHFIESVRELI